MSTSKLTLKQSEKIDNDYKVGEIEYDNRDGLIYINYRKNGSNYGRPVELTWWDSFRGRTLDDKVNIVLEKLKAEIEEEKQKHIQRCIQQNKETENRKNRRVVLTSYAEEKNAEIKQKERELIMSIGESAHGRPADKGAELFKNRPLHENIDELSSAIRSGKVTINKKQVPTSPRPAPPAPQPKRQQDSSFKVAKPKNPNYYRNDDIYEDNDRSGGLFTRDDYASNPCRDSGSSRGGYEPSPSSDGGSCGGGGSDD